MVKEQEEVRNLHSLAVMIGNVSGQINALQQQMQQGNEYTNRRIDDLRGAIDRSSQALNQRIDDHKEAADARFESLESEMCATRNKAYAGSTVIAATMTGFIKLAESLVKGQ